MKPMYRMPSEDAGQPYYFLWRSSGWRYCRFDERGVINASGTYNPITIAQYALHNYAAYRAGDERALARFLAQVRGLLRAQREDGAFPYAFALPRYGLGPGWLSAMAQGQAASALLRAYWATREPMYLDAAARAARLLGTDIACGGVSYMRDRAVFFEEFASRNPVHVLNGHLFAAFGLWEMIKFNVTPDLQELHAAAIATLERWIEKYDAGGWSYYHLGARQYERCLAQLLYHRAHVAQLYVYHRMTGCEVFRETAARWENAMEDPAMRAKVWANGIDWLLTSIQRRIHGYTTPAWAPLEN